MNMNNNLVILIAEDDTDHARLIMRNLKEAGVTNQMMHFQNGEEIWGFLSGQGKGLHLEKDRKYVVLLDIRMPRMTGGEVLKKIKENEDLRHIPVIMITTTDDPREVSKCQRLGCSNFISKPVDYEKFEKAIRQLGLFLCIVKVPSRNERNTQGMLAGILL